MGLMVPELDSHIFELSQRLSASEELNALMQQRLEMQEERAHNEMHKLMQELEVKEQANQEVVAKCKVRQTLQ